jgi:hypothetical protein
MRTWQVRSIQFLCAIILLILCPPVVANNSPEIPVVDGGVGTCRADFTVKDGAGKPIYNANIHVTLKYGFLNLRKTELEVGTNADGKARFTGLPDSPKKPLEFQIKSGTVSESVTDDPSTHCNADYEVTLPIH